MTFRRLPPDMDGDQPLVEGIAILPHTEVADRPHLVRGHIRIALMMAKRHA